LKRGDMIIPINIYNKLEQIFFYEFKLQNILIENGISLFHATHYICPPRRQEYSLITTFHDLGFSFHPNFYPIEKRFYFGNMMKVFLKRSDTVLTVSFSTANLVREYFPEMSDKIQTVYPGTDHLEMKADGFSTKNIFDVPFFLAVNTLEKRKNTSFIIKVFNYLKENFKLNHKLVIVGYHSNDFSAVKREINQSKFKSDIVIKHNIPEDLLVQFYKEAECFFNASEYEGFGFTPIEAMRFGCPAFILENNITSEIFPDYPYILNEMNAEHWAKFIYSEMLYGFSKFKPCKKINSLNWELSAEKTIHCYEKLLYREKKDLVQV
jgi:glycosyltransferase involved in cell wall biosynthesis